MKLLMSTLAAVTIVSSATAATIVVTGSQLGACGLGDAIQAANTDAAVAACPAGSGEDTILFDLPVGQSTASLPFQNTAITASLSIKGSPESPVQISHGGGSISSLLTITGTSQQDIHVTFENVILSHGGSTDPAAAGGNLRITYATVDLLNTTVRFGGAATGGGIYAEQSVLTIDNCIFDSNFAEASGGAIELQGSEARIENSFFVGNNARFVGGGAIYTSSGATITGSTFSANTAGNSSYSADGGAISVVGSPVSVLNSTFSGNRAYGDGGALYVVSDGAVENSTLTNNEAGVLGGGVYLHRFSSLAIRNTIVAGNTAVTNGHEIYFDNTGAGAPAIDGANLFGDIFQETANAVTGIAVGTSNVTATADGSQPTAANDILEDELMDNGGPTMTHALVANSPAIDAGNAGNCPPTDQRGYFRVDNRCDIGAYEAGGSLSAPGSPCFVIRTAQNKTAVFCL